MMRASEKPVFIVDDDAASAASVQALMMAEGLTAEVYRSAEDFLAAYDGSTVGCLILDMRLEGKCGLELQQVLLSRGAPLSIIMISGHADVAMRDQARSKGAVAVLEKPYPASELCKWVHAVLSTPNNGDGG